MFKNKASTLLRVFKKSKSVTTNTTIDMNVSKTKKKKSKKIRTTKGDIELSDDQLSSDSISVIESTDSDLNDDSEAPPPPPPNIVQISPRNRSHSLDIVSKIKGEREKEANNEEVVCSDTEIIVEKHPIPITNNNGSDEEMDNIDLNDGPKQQQQSSNIIENETSSSLLDCIFPGNLNEKEKPWDEFPSRRITIHTNRDRPIKQNDNNKQEDIIIVQTSKSNNNNNHNNNENTGQKDVEMSVIVHKEFARIGEEVLLNAQWVFHEFSLCREKYRDIFQKSDVNKLGKRKNQGVPNILYELMGAVGLGRKSTTNEISSILYSKESTNISESGGRYSIYDAGFLPYYISIILRELLHSGNPENLFDVLLNYCKEHEIEAEYLESFYEMATALSFYRNDVKSTKSISRNITNCNVLCRVLTKFATDIPGSPEIILQKCLENQNIPLFRRLKEHDVFKSIDIIEVLEYAILESADHEIIKQLKLNWAHRDGFNSDDFITVERISSIAYGCGPLSEFKILLESFMDGIKKQHTTGFTTEMHDKLLELCRGIAAGGDYNIIDHFIKDIQHRWLTDNIYRQYTKSCVLLLLGQLALHRRDRYCTQVIDSFPSLDASNLKPIIDIIEKLLDDRTGNNLPITREDRQILRTRSVPIYLQWKDGRKRELERTLKTLKCYYNKFILVDDKKDIKPIISKNKPKKNKKNRKKVTTGIAPSNINVQ